MRRWDIACHIGGEPAQGARRCGGRSSHDRADYYGLNVARGPHDIGLDCHQAAAVSNVRGGEPPLVLHGFSFTSTRHGCVAAIVGDHRWPQGVGYADEDQAGKEEAAQVIGDRPTDHAVEPDAEARHAAVGGASSPSYAASSSVTSFIGGGSMSADTRIVGGACGDTRPEEDGIERLGRKRSAVAPPAVEAALAMGVSARHVDVTRDGLVPYRRPPAVADYTSWPMPTFGRRLAM